MIDMRIAVQRLCIHEGVRLKPYKCSAGYLTIGVGRNLTTNPISVEEQHVVGDWQHGITQNAAFYLLRNDIRRVCQECKQHIQFWKELDDERQYALLDMAFNLGIRGLLKFERMISAMSIGDYRGAAKECLNSKYAAKVGKRAERIAKTIETGRFEI